MAGGWQGVRAERRTPEPVRGDLCFVCCPPPSLPTHPPTHPATDIHPTQPPAAGSGGQRFGARRDDDGGRPDRDAGRADDRGRREPAPRTTPRKRSSSPAHRPPAAYGVKLPNHPFPTREADYREVERRHPK